MVNDTIAAGATLLCGHRREGPSIIRVLEGVPQSCKLWREEVFAPVVMPQSFDALNDAIAMANDPEYSLHAGFFTSSIGEALHAAARIETGGVMITAPPITVSTPCPFSGFKYGSMGREGVRFAYEDTTQPKVVCIDRT